MRQIKFRAWHYHKNWSKDGVPLKPGMEYNFWVSNKGEVAFPEGDWDINSVEKPEGLVLMQYTGCKDKKGNEIYEGDIVRKTMKSNNKEVSFNEEVEWIDRFACFTITGDLISRNIIKTGYDNIEVVGNIYENPLLILNKKK